MGDNVRACNVIQYRLPRIFGFHQRHVLVSRGVEYGGRLVGANNVLDAHGILDVADRTHQRNRRITFLEFLLDAI